ncbi:MAG: hypothetical protein NTY98_04450 [Verrucomicrobia bacterium]|nr:hypothetical protein [Verrucomicrobiota bacterium]
MTFLPSRLTARHGCGALAVLVFAHCAYAYWKSLPRQMAKFANWHMKLTVEEVPLWSVPGEFLFGDAVRFDYRFTLTRGDKLSSSFVIHGESSSRFRKAELKPDPIPNGKEHGDGDEDERVNLVCALDGALRVICRGELYHQIHWSTEWGRRSGASVDEAAHKEALTFLSDAGSMPRTPEETALYIQFLLEQIGERPPEEVSGNAFHDMVVRSKNDQEMPLGERFPNAQKLVDVGDAALLPLALHLAQLPEDPPDPFLGAYKALRKMRTPVEIVQLYRELSSKASTEEERRRFERAMLLYRY